MNTSFLAFANLGTAEIIMILVIVLLLFGAKKLPELARGIGKSMGEFKRARNDFESELHRAADQAEQEALDKKREEDRKRAELATAKAAAEAPAPVTTNQS